MRVAVSSARIVFHQVRFFHGDQFKALPLQFSNDALLDIQAPCKPVQPFDQDKPHAVRMQGEKHLHEGGPVLQFLFSADPTLPEDANHLDVVGGGVAIDGLKLPGVAISAFLALAAHSQVCEARRILG